jgi:ankyrin repeat protein
MKDHEGLSALSFAVKAGQIDIVRLLLEKGANARSAALNRAQPIHFAAAGNHVDIINLLHEGGAKLTADSEVGTPLHWAAGYGQVNALIALIELGANSETLNQMVCRYSSTVVGLIYFIRVLRLSFLPQLVEILSASFSL